MIYLLKVGTMKTKRKTYQNLLMFLILTSANFVVLSGGNTPPAADAGADDIYNTLDNVRLDGTGSDANDVGQNLTYLWQQTAGITVTLSDNDVEEPEFEAPKLRPDQAPIELIFSLVVNDGFDDSDADTVVITIEPFPKTEPVFNAVVLNYFVDPSDSRLELGDLLFSPDGSSVKLIVGSETNASAAITADVFRDLNKNVIGFSLWTEDFAALNMDTGLEYAPDSNTLFYHQTDLGIGQRTDNGAQETYVIQNYNAEYGGLAFVPNKYNNAGDLLKSEYEDGRLFLHPVSDDGDDTFTISPANLVSQLPAANSGDIQYITTGLLKDHIAVAQYGDEESAVYLIAVDPITGLPSMNPETTVFLGNTSGAWGLTTDPITGNMWLIDYDYYTLTQLKLDELIFKSGFE